MIEINVVGNLSPSIIKGHNLKSQNQTISTKTVQVYLGVDRQTETGRQTDIQTDIYVYQVDSDFLNAMQ